MTKLIWLTDLHLVRDGTPSPADVDPLQRLRLALGAVRADHGDADLLVISGDLVQRGHTEAYHALRQALEGSDMPCRLLVGNHDDRTSLQEAFPENPWLTASYRALTTLDMPAFSTSTPRRPMVPITENSVRAA